MSQLDALFKDLAHVLLPYSDFISTSGAWLSVLQIVSPAFVLNRIRNNRVKSKIPIFPFMFITMYMIISLRYSQITNNEALYESNLKGFTFSAAYLSIYYYLCPQHKKKENLIYLSSASALLTFIYYYSVNGNQSKMAVKYEAIMTSVLWSFYFIALLGVRHGFKHKTSAHLGFEMIFGSFLMGINRICYGILKNRQFYVFQNVFFLSVHLAQLSCFILYGSKVLEKKVKNEKEKVPQKKRLKKGIKTE